MDFWEGFFLGKYWTDSNYEDRSHKLFFVVISAVVCLLTIISFVLPQQIQRIFILPFWASILLGLVLLTGMPFAAAQYHKVNIFIKLLILFGYILQYFFLLSGFVQIFSSQMAIETESLPSLFLELLDGIMYSSGEIFTFLGSLGSTIVSVIGGMIIGGIVVLGLFFIAIFIPLAYIILFRTLQRLIDKTIYRKIYGIKID